MPFLWIAVPDEPGALSLRGYIEANSVALLSNHRRPLDGPSPDWLGRHSDRVAIRESGLWNVNHVDGQADRSFLGALTDLVSSSVSAGRA
jgi:hypothetical protein